MKDNLVNQIKAREGKLMKELEELKRNIKMMANTSTLDEIADSGRKASNNWTRLGFERTLPTKTNTVFVKGSISDSTSTLTEAPLRQSLYLKYKGRYVKWKKI